MPTKPPPKLPGDSGYEMQMMMGPGPKGPGPGGPAGPKGGGPGGPGMPPGGPGGPGADAAIANLPDEIDQIMADLGGGEMEGEPSEGPPGESSPGQVLADALGVTPEHGQELYDAAQSYGPTKGKSPEELADVLTQDFSTLTELERIASGGDDEESEEEDMEPKGKPGEGGLTGTGEGGPPIEATE